ncbi:MAG: UDP-N-acetylglucosamine 2-epimerase (non-hydrolyzing) [Sulfuricaulis sp.]|nr:UDP-N-acetylglucosamine 2-epimerase (non-hydrolyzing) [Sulfuricaulis sp.]
MPGGRKRGENLVITSGHSPILCVVGARPNFMKIAPLMAALRAEPNSIPVRLLHTGQHYDVQMKDAFFTQLGIPEPDVDLGVGSASHAVQTAEIMRRFEPALDQEKPAAVLVVGDVNSTIACALVAAKKDVPVIHVEAGLRSYDRGMPEEINRVLTDQISDLLFITERSARDNLLREGIDERRIHFVGNVMIDTLLGQLPRALPPEQTLARAPDPKIFLGSASGYALLTLHRPSNVDEPQVLRRMLETLRQVSDDLPIVFPIHPRTSARIEQAGLGALLDTPRIWRLSPLSYLEMLGLMAKARIVLTDSGGIQEETTALGVPCITLRENTERPITVDQGTNTVVGSNPAHIKAAVADVLASGGKAGRIPELWDGKASQRIKAVLLDWLARGQPRQRSAKVI